ncbi:urease accessory protein UreF, partial [Streptomyces sp. NPDC089795]
MSRAALLVLADGRFPAGGHAHSGGAEAACKAGRIHDAATLEDFRPPRRTAAAVPGCPRRTG